MKKLGILGTTTLAGALLFTGVNSNADAAEVINDDNVKDYAQQAIGSKYTEAGQVTSTVMNETSDYYEISFSAEQDNGPATAKVYKESGKVVGVTPRDPVNEIVFKEGQQPEASQNQTTEAQASNNVNDQQVNQQTSNQEQTSEKAHTSQSEVSELPETGSEETNTPFVIIIASILLGAGSLLTFKRFSKKHQ